MRRGGAWVVPRRQGRKKKTCLWVIHFYHINAQKISILLNVVHHHRLYASFATGHAAMEINVPSLPGRPRPVVQTPNATGCCAIIYANNAF